MQYSRWECQNIALAAVAQCATLVESLATRGIADESAMSACIDPLLNFSPGSVAEIYPNISQLSPGLRALQDIFGTEKQDRSSEIIRYLLGILALRQKLMSDQAMQGKIHEELAQVKPPSPANDSTQEESDRLYYKQLADTYQHTISTYTFRIHVKGNMEFLKDENTANKIRALLLAGIRSAVLWYQIGGRRWHLILHRKKIRQTCSHIRRNLITSV